MKEITGIIGHIGSGKIAAIAEPALAKTEKTVIVVEDSSPFDSEPMKITNPYAEIIQIAESMPIKSGKQLRRERRAAERKSKKR